MQNNSKSLTVESKNIFLQKSFTLVLQFPFENPTTVENLKRILAKHGLLFRKISKSALYRQLMQINVDFVPTLGANFVLTSEKTESVLDLSSWKEIFSLIQQHKATFLFLHVKESKHQVNFWYDSERVLKHSSLSGQPPFSSHLLQILRNKTVLPLLNTHTQRLLFFLDRARTY